MRDNRRKFITLSLASAAGVGLISTTSFAQANEEEGELKEELILDISANHGHNLELSSIQLLSLLRETEANEGASVTLDIQGTSSHPHQVELSQKSLYSIALGDSFSTISSSDFGHSHTITISLNIT